MVVNDTCSDIPKAIMDIHVEITSPCVLNEDCISVC